MSAGRWGDLAARLASGAVMALVGLGAIWLGGAWFAALAAAAGGVMVWELARMIAPERARAAIVAGAATVLAVLAARFLESPGPGLVVLAVPALLGAALLGRGQAVYAAFAVAIAVASWGLGSFRDDYGMVWLVWLMLVVIATDVFGYFAGRRFGGPKLWPAVTPSKTWSGTVAGWVASGLIGAAFLSFTDAGRDLPWISVALSMASQAGDIAESALKRRFGVKDSSNLLPGHGGLFDRFDGVLGAALFMLLVAQFVYVPQVRF